MLYVLKIYFFIIFEFSLRILFENFILFLSCDVGLKSMFE